MQCSRRAAGLCPTKINAFVTLHLPRPTQPQWLLWWSQLGAETFSEPTVALVSLYLTALNELELFH